MYVARYHIAEGLRFSQILIFDLYSKINLTIWLKAITFVPQTYFAKNVKKQLTIGNFVPQIFPAIHLTQATCRCSEVKCT